MVLCIFTLPHGSCHKTLPGSLPICRGIIYDLFVIAMTIIWATFHNVGAHAKAPSIVHYLMNMYYM